MDGLGAGGTAASNIGAVSFDSEVARDIADANEVIYAYTGSSSNPTFLTAITNGQFALGAGRGTLANTGLTVNENAVVLISSADVAVYHGDTSHHVSLDEYAALLFNTDNWTLQGGTGDQSHDGILADLPFPTTPFTPDPTAQRIDFATSSVSVQEGNSGETGLTLTLTRTGSTSGAVTVTGNVTVDGNSGSADEQDFGGTLPEFTATFADGATTTTVTIKLSGDTAYEIDENFIVNLTGVSSADGNAYLGAATQVQATIVNDDPIQYVGFAPDSVTVAEPEGGAGDVRTFSFVIQRSGDSSTTGEISFSGDLVLNTADDDDFGGTAPMHFSGTIAEGQSSAIVTITTTGDNVFENDENL